MREHLIEQIKNIKKGAFTKIEYFSDKGNGVIKKTSCVVRLGINYYNIKHNKTKETHSLPWGKWVEGLEGYVLEHTNKKGEYHQYLRLYTTNIKSIKTEYSLNGVITQKQDLIERGLLKDKPSTITDCFNVPMENILSLGCE